MPGKNIALPRPENEKATARNLTADHRLPDSRQKMARNLAANHRLPDSRQK